MNIRSVLGPFPFPRQHGAWAMFLVPGIMALFLADIFRGMDLIILAGFILVFLSHQPAVRLTRRWVHRRIVDSSALRWSLLLGIPGGLCVIIPLFLDQRWWALLMCWIVLFTLVIHLRFTLDKKHMSVPGELIGLVGLTASAPILYLYEYHIMDARGWVLWGINFLYFAGSIFYIKLKLRVQPFRPQPDWRGRLRAGWMVIAYSVAIMLFMVITSIVRKYSWYFPLAFLPFIVKSITGVFRWRKKGELHPVRLGVAEIVHALIFAVISILGFLNTPHGGIRA